MAEWGDLIDQIRPAEGLAASAAPTDPAQPTPLGQYYLDHLKRIEGERGAGKPYWDYKQWSGPYGTRASGPDDRIDLQEGERRLLKEVAAARAVVDRVAPGAPDGVKAALTSLTYNAGGGWANAGLGKAVQSGDYDAAQQLFRSYNKAGGATLPGLVARREAEAAWFKHPTEPASAGLSTLAAAAPPSTTLQAALTVPAPSETVATVAAPAPAVGTFADIMSKLTTPDAKGASPAGTALATLGKAMTAGDGAASNSLAKRHQADLQALAAADGEARQHAQALAQMIAARRKGAFSGGIGHG